MIASCPSGLQPSNQYRPRVQAEWIVVPLRLCLIIKHNHYENFILGVIQLVAVAVNLDLVEPSIGDYPRLQSTCMNAVLQVCLVDDTADYRLLVEAIFERYLPAYSLRLFVSGKAFLDTLPQLSEKPNLVLLDQHMPLLNGYQTLVALKGQSQYRFIPVVMMSADASHSEIKSFYEAGARCFLAKSTDFNALTETLVAACQLASKPQ